MRRRRPPGAHEGGGPTTNTHYPGLDDFFSKLKVLQVTLPDGFMSLFVKIVDCYPNVSIAYRILLIVHVIVASAKRSFSKLILLRNCLRTTMLQKRLNGLVKCSIEKGILDNIDLDTFLMILHQEMPDGAFL